MILFFAVAAEGRAAPPLISSRYRNSLFPAITNEAVAPAWYASYTNTAGWASVGGCAATNVAGPATTNLVLAESSFGEPFVGLRADFQLGDVIPPPDDVDTSIDPLMNFMGGAVCAEWIDYANQLVVSGMGVVEITWTLSDGTTQVITYTFSPNPAKRPVRLYWTEGQNAGPRIMFGSNYRVDLYYNNEIRDTNDVWIADNMLHAATGARGRFLLTYSRLDEDTGKRTLLAYEIVEVLEPMSAMQRAHVGERLLPMARPYGTDDLVAEIVRGAVDPTGQETPFVYQHTQGAKKGRVWAIRETAAPWQIEMYWKAKEELDVLWPFEVDIYDVTWGSNAQTYIRGNLAQGDLEPKVFFPSDLVVEVMPHQKPDNHAFYANSVFYSTTEGYCLLKYTHEDGVWFEPVHSISYLNPLCARSNTVAWAIADELRPVVPGTRTRLEDAYGAWPGYVFRPSGTAYNVDRYNYPAAYTPPADIASYLFPVNKGALEVWWANESLQDDLPSPVFFPSLANRYDCDWPQQAREIVIASGLGNEGVTLRVDATGCAAFDLGDLTYEEAQVFGCHLVLDDPNNLDFPEQFTLELWVKPDTLTGIQYLIEKGSNYRLRLNAGVPELFADGRWYSSGVLLAIGEWQHLAVTLHELGDVDFYLDGMPIQSEPFLGWLQTDSMPLRLGAHAAGWGPPDAFFSGRMDEVRLWTVARSAAQIQSHLVESVVQSTYGLRAYYRFEEDDLSSSYILSDSSTFLNHILLPPLGVERVAPGIPQTDPGLSLAGTEVGLYVQNDRAADGFNPNEEHAILVQGMAFALRTDLNVTDEASSSYTSEPFVLLDCRNPLVNANRPYMQVFRVVASNEVYQFRRYWIAGNMIQPPYPISLMVPSNCSSNNQVAGPRFRDRKGYYWARQAGDDNGTTNYVFDFYYPMQSDFWFPALAVQPAVGTQIPWLTGLSTNGTPLDFTFVVSWPDSVPVLAVGDTLTNAKEGLPAIRGQLSVGVPYQQSLALTGRASVDLIDPTVFRPAPLAEIPAGMKSYRDVRTACWFFSDLPPALRPRLFFNPMASLSEELQFVGAYHERTDGHNYLMLNVLGPDNRAACTNESLVSGIAGTGGDDWRTAIGELPDSVVLLANDETPFDSLALPTTGLGAGYVTVVFNDSTDENMVDPSENIDMAVFRVIPELYRGRLDVVLSANPLDKQINVYYTADFRGTPEKWEFKWQYADPSGGEAPDAGQDSLWHDYGAPQSGRHFVTVGDAGVFGLSDHYLRCTYRPLDPEVIAVAGTNWAAWTPPVLCEGWIKRVLKAINPYDQRIRDFMNYAVLTDLSMIQQIGAPYNGDIPLNYEALNEYGLMQIYETINRQADSLSVEAGLVADDGLALALLMVKGRLSDLYMVLGNEAYGDALNPTIQIGDDSADQLAFGEATSMFCFQNQLPNLLAEELALLRGRDDSMNPDVSEYPLYNRLAWNITADIMGGQVAYMLNYGISDLKGNQNGVLDAADAATLYPQGHGDAYGHYLSALKGYYAYLHDPFFSWYPDVEGILVDSTEVTVSFLHEKKFAVAAAARARTTEGIVNRAWRAAFTEEDGWMAARDSDATRAWGYGEWGCRGGQGAYFDWLTGNSLVPTADPDANHAGTIRAIDRNNLPELNELTEIGKRLQQQVDFADGGLNPLGLAPDAVPFDISSTGIDAGETHFEQIFARATKALQTAASVFIRVKDCAGNLRDQNEERDLDADIQTEEAAMNRRLIELFGYPYADDIGPGKIYAQGYSGPDLLHYLYVDTWPLDSSIASDQRQITLTLTDNLYSIRTNSLALSSPQSGILAWLVNTSGGDYGDGAQTYDVVSAYYDTQRVHTVTMNVANNGIPVKPASYTGKRRADGEIQIALSEYLAAIADVSSAIGDAQYISDEIKRTGDAWLVTQGYKVDGLMTTMDAHEDTRTLKTIVAGINGALELGGAIDDSTSKMQDAIIEGIPKIIGLMAVDGTAPARGALKTVGTVFHYINLAAKVIGKIAISQLEARITDIGYALERDLLALDIQNEARQAGFQILGLLQQQANSLSTVQAALQRAETARMQFTALVGEGDRVQIERERLRMNWASDLAAQRYRNMAYQVFRNDELVRYEQAFDAAARYVYLAAKAYDYETGLLPGDATHTAGRDFMRQIVRSRALGRFSHWTQPNMGEPLVGGATGDPGLADAMARMDANWQVLKGRLSFNNPQQETGRFSLRTELFRLSPESASDGNWRATLNACKVANLRALPEFNRYCLPFDPMQDVEPGLVIPFSTTVEFRKNFFGRLLAAGDNAYDSTHFATKIRSVGVWFSNFNNAFGEGLANQPRVYLVPAGVDSMRVPFGSQTVLRRWQVVDQALPVPYAISGTEWEQPDWSSLKNVLGNELFRIRRFPSMLAFHDAGDDDAMLEVNWNSRLIGRSVWNSRWLLIIPGGTLLSDADEGLARLIDGPLLPTGQRSGNGIKDIKLYFHTYSYSGN